MLRRIERLFTPSFDWPIAITMLIICSFGLTTLYSAGFNHDTMASLPMKRQLIYMGLGIFLFLAAMLFNVSFWRRWAYVFYAIGCLLLVVILVAGDVAGGARRWLDFGPFKMQPSEFMKLGIIFLCARIFSSEKLPSEGYTIKSMIAPCSLLLLPLGLTLIQPDLGTALVQALVGGSMLLLAGVQTGTLLRLGGIGLLSLYPAWHLLKPYQQNRILNFMTPELDPLGTGYHAIQSKIAVGSGAIAGKGLLQGTQTQLRFLPEQTTDFIFSVLAEEWGFIGSGLAVVLYGFLIYRILKVCSRASDKFAAYMCFGVAALIFWHVLFNVGMVIGVLPVVGVTLPLFSYGGSSVFTVMIGLGLVAGVSIRRFLFA